MRIIDTHANLNRSKFIQDLNNHITNKYSSKGIDISLAGILILYNNMLDSLFDFKLNL